MENPIIISNLNDFIFCPVSIYFHNVEGNTDVMLYQEKSQLDGTAVHQSVDKSRYSSRKNMLQAIEVLSEKYDLVGKIDMYDDDKKILIERKKKITTIYDGYIFQVYAQYFALKEMGYNPERIQLYSYDDNKKYEINLPENDKIMFAKFERVIFDIKHFDIYSYVATNVSKCERCIYEELCCFSCLK